MTSRVLRCSAGGRMATRLQGVWAYGKRQQSPAAVSAGIQGGRGTDSTSRVFARDEQAGGDVPAEQRSGQPAPFEASASLPRRVRGTGDRPRPPARVARPVLPESFLERVRAAAEAARREEEHAPSDTSAGVVPATTGSAFVPPSREAPAAGAPANEVPANGAASRAAAPECHTRSPTPPSATPRHARHGPASTRTVDRHPLDLVAAAGTRWQRQPPAAYPGRPSGAVGGFPGAGAGRDPGRRRRRR